MIRVLVVDDHPALRAGLATVLRTEPGLVFAGESGGEEESLWPVLHRTRPDVVLLDYHLPQDDGLQLCHRIKAIVPAPKVILFSAHAGAGLALPATLAGADALAGKALPARELFELIRRVARGERALPPIARSDLSEAAERLRAEDLPLLGMLLDDTPAADLGPSLGLAPGEATHRVRRMLGDLRPDVAARVT